MNCADLLLKFIQVLATTSIGVATGIIAYHQFRLARHKLKADLFDKRLQVFFATREYLNSILGSGKIDGSALFQFYLAVSHAEFLFGPEIKDYLQDLDKRGHALKTAFDSGKGSDLPAGDPRKLEAIGLENQIFESMVGEIGTLRKKFTPYLDIYNFD
ncbi:hypothetical protein EI77_02987 [Prosthecobacter fusiformis]|uniref:Uncharacterized protein n=1 Tax=Prosthecobacter fusiformis TaxID=48464 RepID=A0A4R7RUB8_9BACT|nr:hypothetical protein [Prosthecobacter fusiformis]TDU69334.1 hypothetical protein EI77_02987 [Prosthecobacter fusiformis]